MELFLFLIRIYHSYVLYSMIHTGQYILKTNLSLIHTYMKVSSTHNKPRKQSTVTKPIFFFSRPPPPPPFQNILLVTGDRGVGKSAVLAHWLQEFADENPGIFLLYHFIGATPGDNDIAAFLRRCTRDLRKHFLLTGLVLF